MRNPLLGRTAVPLMLLCVLAPAVWFITTRDRDQEKPFVAQYPAYRRVSEGMTEAQIVKLLGVAVVVWNNPHAQTCSPEEVPRMWRDRTAKEQDTDATCQRMEDAWVSSSPEERHLKKVWEHRITEQDKATKAFRRVIKQSWTYRLSGWSSDITIAFDMRGEVVYHNAALNRSYDYDPAFG